MNRFYRWSFHLLAGTSLIFFCLTAFVFIRSFIFDDIYDYAFAPTSKNGAEMISVSFDYGHLGFSRRRASTNIVGYFNSEHTRFQAFPDPPGFRPYLWDHWQTNPAVGVKEDHFEAGMPLWFFLLIFTFAPILWIANWRRDHHITVAVKRRICAACGYDLRATPDRCPECGKIVERVI